MSTRTRRGDAAMADARRSVARVTTELREAASGAAVGVSSRPRVSGLSSSQLSRLELGRLERPDFEQLWRAASVVGLRPSLMLYPAGSPVRDRAQLALLARFEQYCIGEPLRMRREVPLPLQGDLRAWFCARRRPGWRVLHQGESHVRDAQALERRIRLKVRDDPRARVVILVLTRSDHHRAVSPSIGDAACSRSMRMRCAGDGAGERDRARCSGGGLVTRSQRSRRAGGRLRAPYRAAARRRLHAVPRLSARRGRGRVARGPGNHDGRHECRPVKDLGIGSGAWFWPERGSAGCQWESLRV